MDMLEFLRQSLRNMTRDKNTLYVFSPGGIGDFLIVGGLCHALLKKKHKQTCVLIVNETYANSGLNFVGVKEVQYIPKILVELIRKYIYATREYETDNYIFGHFQMKPTFEDWNNVIWDTNLPLVHRYKQNAFDLPQNTELIPPLIESLTEFQIQRLHENYNPDKERTIVLMPHANSLGNLDKSFWEKLASVLIRKGYVVYTNIANSNENVLRGTKPMVTTFSELLYLAEKVKCFIGIRSGIFDLLALTNARLIYVITGIKHWFFDLSVNYNHNNSSSFYIDGLNLSDIQIFMQQNNIDSIDNVLFDDHVPGKFIAFDLDSLFEKILRAVD